MKIVREVKEKARVALVLQVSDLWSYLGEATLVDQNSLEKLRDT